MTCVSYNIEGLWHFFLGLLYVSFLKDGAEICHHAAATAGKVRSSKVRQEISTGDAEISVWGLPERVSWAKLHFLEFNFGRIPVSCFFCHVFWARRVDCLSSSLNNYAVYRVCSGCVEYLMGKQYRMWTELDILWLIWSVFCFCFFPWYGVLIMI